jgi:hypothetical protein
MQRLFAAALAVTCAVGVIGTSTPGFARGPGAGMTRGMAPHAGIGRRGIGGEAGPPQVPAESRIPTPLAAPAQSPVINGPLQQSPNGLPPMGGAR